jgi:iron(III) transport system substrate-binding protein
VAAGLCAVGIANTYYYGRLVKESPDIPVALFWANQQAEGVHVNVAGAGVVRYASHPKQALALLEWMSTQEPQKLFADINMEYPVNPAVKPADIVASWGEFKPNLINVNKAGELQVKAVKLMDRAGYK